MLAMSLLSCWIGNFGVDAAPIADVSFCHLCSQIMARQQPATRRPRDSGSVLSLNLADTLRKLGQFASSYNDRRTKRTCANSTSFEHVAPCATSRHFAAFL